MRANAQKSTLDFFFSNLTFFQIFEKGPTYILNLKSILTLKSSESFWFQENVTVVNLTIFDKLNFCYTLFSKITDYGLPIKRFFFEIQKFWAWADKFWRIWGIFGQTISTHFGKVRSLSIFFIAQPLFLKKNQLYIHVIFGIGI